GKEYLFVILFGLLPFALTQVYSGTLREGGESAVPMMAGVSAIAVNIALNLILIFGYLGAPALGVRGAAVATVASRFVELLIVLIYTHANAKRWGFITHAYRRLFSVPGRLVGQLAIRSFPLIVNELLWSVGTTAVVRNYSTRGLSVVAALTITTTAANVFNSVNFGIGASVSIVAGHSLGANRPDDAQRDACRMIALATFSCFFVGGALAALSPFFPLIYNTEEGVRRLATSLLLVASCCMPIGAFMQASYFTIRSGGKTLVTFLFDSVFVLAVSFPASYLLAQRTALPIVWVYLIVTLLDLIKCAVGFVLIRKRVWLRNLVSDQTA
ncbi:MAG: polysaccharide biosynthesis C-terminal domain-containing protein, partial [Clostridia bacterium]|nr:polysaccharide biosynthesis C-terminal domain-containing protein [Clostridia bacterium]